MSALNGPADEPRASRQAPLGDFTTDRRLLALSGLAILLGGVSAVLALLLLQLIGLFTNLFFFGR